MRRGGLARGTAASGGDPQPSRSRRLLVTLVVVSLVVLAAMGVWQAATAPAARDLEARTQAIASVLRCPTCQNLSAADSPSATAQSMRDTIAEQLAAGRTEQEIFDWFVDRYGPWVLLYPPREGLNWVLWTAPIAAALAAAAIAARRILRRPVQEGPLDDAAEQRVEHIYQHYLAGEEVAPGGGPDAERLHAALELLATVRQEPGADDDPGLVGSVRAHQLAAREVLDAIEAATASPQRTGSPHDAPAAWRRLGGWAAVTAAFLLSVGVLLPSAIGVRGVGAVATGGTDGDARAEVLSERLADGPAIAALRETLEADPDDAAARRGLADALAARGRLAEALTHYRHVLVSDPDDVRLRVTIGVLLLQLGAYDDAEQELQPLLAQEADHTEALLVTGLAQAARDEAEGVATLRRFLELAPDDHPGIPLARGMLDRDLDRDKER